MLRLAGVGEVTDSSGARVLRISRSYGVTASTLDSESSDRGSNPRRTLFLQHHVGPIGSVVTALRSCPGPLGACGMAAPLKPVVLNLATAFVTSCKKARGCGRKQVSTDCLLGASVAQCGQAAPRQPIPHARPSQTRFKRASGNRHLWDSNPRGETPSA